MVYWNWKENSLDREAGHCDRQRGHRRKTICQTLKSPVSPNPTRNSTPPPLTSTITHLGNPAANWNWTREQVIASIDAKSNTFYVTDPKTGKRSEVGVVRVAGRAPYVRTHADGDWNNNLLSLNTCPL